MMQIPELLAPAGNPERLRTALHFGADAVYLGMQRMSLRNFADNFSLDSLFEGCLFAHERNKRVYVTINAFAHDAQLKELPGLVRDIRQAGADALIVNDPGVLEIAKETVPGMKLHLSTQANTLNAKAASFWHRQGIGRIVLARELTLKEIAAIAGNVPDELELEMFVHGAMCVSYSGRCLLSNYMNGRDSNRGECVQPCRWAYEIRERGANGESFAIEQDEAGAYILNARDLNLIRHLPEICRTGVNSVKIEGRMKSIYYVAGVVNAYRMALDVLSNGADRTPDFLEEELNKVSHRPYYTGFALGNPESYGQATHSAQYEATHELAAQVLSYDNQEQKALIEQRNRFFEGDVLEIVSPGDVSRSLIIHAMQTEEGEPLQAAPHPKQRLFIHSDSPLTAGDLLRKRL